MSVSERASLDTTRAPFPSAYSAPSRPAFERPVTSTRAPLSRSIFAVARPIPLVPPIIAVLLAWYRSMCIFLVRLGRFADIELFGTFLDGMTVVKDILN